jgi:opacity protein-like surface antigen
MLRRAIPILAALVLASVPTAAGAQVYIVGELSSPSYLDDGFPDVLPDIPDRYSAGARVGYTFGEGVKFSIEGGAAYATFTTDTPPSTVYQGFGGIRIAVGDVLSPGLYGHVGYGEVRVEPEQGGDRFRQGVTARAGVSLDLFSTSSLVLGAHLDWNRIFLNTAFEAIDFDEDWAELGIHAGARF